MATDTLSDVLRSVRLRGAVFYDLSFGADWAAEAPPANEIAEAVIPSAEHVMEYHVITLGSGWAAIVGESPVRLETGDIVMFLQGDAHVISSAPGIRPVRISASWIHSTRNEPKPIPVVFHTPNEFTHEAAVPELPTQVACGFLGCDLRPFNPLIATLPHMLHLPAAGDGAWISQVMQQAVNASRDQRPGGQAVLERISEMMFADAIRRYVETLPEQSTGWLAGLRNRSVGRALALIHAQPARAWTVEELAAGAAHRARRSSSASSRSSASRPCNTSRSGACRWRRIYCGVAVRRSCRMHWRSVMNRRRRLRGHLRDWRGCHRGVAEESRQRVSDNRFRER